MSVYVPTFSTICKLCPVSFVNISVWFMKSGHSGITFFLSVLSLSCLNITTWSYAREEVQVCSLSIKDELFDICEILKL